MADLDGSRDSESLDPLCGNEAELEAMLAERKQVNAENAITFEGVAAEKRELAERLAAGPDSDEVMERASAHVERLAMQLEDLLSVEGQAVAALESAARTVWSPLSAAAAVALTAAALAVAWTAMRRRRG